MGQAEGQMEVPLEEGTKKKKNHSQKVGGLWCLTECCSPAECTRLPSETGEYKERRRRDTNNTKGILVFFPVIMRRTVGVSPSLHSCLMAILEVQDHGMRGTKL